MSGFRGMLVAGFVGAAALASVGVAQAEPWDPWLPGIPGPGVNIGVPGNPLPPGQVKKWIPNVDDLIPNWGAPGQWR